MLEAVVDLCDYSVGDSVPVDQCRIVPRVQYSICVAFTELHTDFCLTARRFWGSSVSRATENSDSIRKSSGNLFSLLGTRSSLGCEGCIDQQEARVHGAPFCSASDSEARVAASGSLSPAASAV